MALIEIKEYTGNCYDYDCETLQVEIIKTEVYSRKIRDYMATVHISYESAEKIGMYNPEIGTLGENHFIEFQEIKTQNPELELVYSPFVEYTFQQWKEQVISKLDKLGITLDDCRDVALDDLFEEFPSPNEAVRELLS